MTMVAVKDGNGERDRPRAPGPALAALAGAGDPDKQGGADEGRDGPGDHRDMRNRGYPVGVKVRVLLPDRGLLGTRRHYANDRLDHADDRARVHDLDRI
jgi:hypothetical protein